MLMGISSTLHPSLEVDMSGKAGIPREGRGCEQVTCILKGPLGKGLTLGLIDIMVDL